MDAWAIDVSRWQGWIDWWSVKDAGVQGAWVKVGGADGGFYKDSKFENNKAGCLTVSMHWGTYFFASPGWGDAASQAAYAVSIGHGQGDLWPMLDIEHNPNGLSPGQLDDWCWSFTEEVRRLTGRTSEVYSGAYFGVGFNAGHAIGTLPFHVANYGSNVPGTSPPSFNPAVPAAWADTGWAAWQYNSVTMIPGIPENTCDQNTVREAFWNDMLGGAPPEEEEVAQRSVVRTKPGSQWAMNRVNYNATELWWTIMEGSGTVRHLHNWDMIQQECFWLSMDPYQTWVVEDAFLDGRYLYENEAATSTAVSTNAVIVFAVMLVALLWILLELGRWAEWYSVTHGQIGALVGVTVVVAALAAAFARLHGAWVIRKVRRHAGPVGAPAPSA